MRDIAKMILVLAIAVSLLPSAPVSADDATVTETQVYEGIRSTAEDPLVIDGLNITTDGDGMIIRDCENVIVRNCSIMYCAYTDENIPADFRAEGMALLIDNCSNVTVENCIISYNLMGLKVRDSKNVTISGNTVANNVYHAAILLENCEDSLVTGNIVEDNGFPERFYEAGGSKRVIGICIIRGSNIEVSYNRSCRNTSDGISVFGQDYFVDDPDDIWKGIVENVTVHDNYIEDNDEQGIWSNRSRNCKFYDNEIHMDGSDVGIGVAFAFDFDVEDAEVWGNTVYASKIPHAGGLSVSHNNYFHDNILYTSEYCEFILEETMIPGYDYSDDEEKAKSAGIEMVPSYGNVDEDNGIVVMGDDGSITVGNVKATAEDPFILEGVSITTEGDGLVVRNCENVIVRNCSIMYCAYTEENILPESDMPGMGLYIEGCSNVTVEGSTISYNLMGLKVVDSEGVTLSGNDVSNNVYHCAIMLVRCTDCLVTGNNVGNNGFPERFYEYGGGKRIVGIYIVRGSDIEISYNRSVGNTSDGIMVGGQDYSLEASQPSEVWKGLVENVSVHDNYIADNHEQGIWVARARDCQFYDNEIHVDCSEIGIGNGICFELDVIGAEAWGNTIYACKVAVGVAVAASHDNYFHDNVLYTYEETQFMVEETMIEDYDYTDDIHKAKLAGIEHMPSSGNVGENNATYVNGEPYIEETDAVEGGDDDSTPLLGIGAIACIFALVGIALLWRRGKNE